MMQARHFACPLQQFKRSRSAFAKPKVIFISSNVTKTFQFKPEPAQLCFALAKSLHTAFQLIDLMHLSFYVVNLKKKKKNIFQKLQMHSLLAVLVQHIKD